MSLEGFADEAIAAIADVLIAEAVTPSAAMTAADIPGNSLAAGGVLLEAVRDLVGVNALASNQQLTFGADGLTIVDGDNASGKSGYARLLKHAAGVNVRDDILTDVFSKASSTAQSAVIDYAVGETTPNQQWKWPGPPSAWITSSKAPLR